MEFTPRIQQILRILLDRDEPVGKQEIADELGVSKERYKGNSNTWSYVSGSII